MEEGDGARIKCVDNPAARTAQLLFTALEELLRYDGPVSSVTRLSLSAMMQRMT